MLPNSAWGHSTRTQVNGGVFLTIHSNSHNPVGGDISLSGDDVLIKTYGHIYYWYDSLYLSLPPYTIESI